MRAHTSLAILGGEDFGLAVRRLRLGSGRTEQRLCQQGQFRSGSPLASFRKRGCAEIVRTIAGCRTTLKTGHQQGRARGVVSGFAHSGNEYATVLHCRATGEPSPLLQDSDYFVWKRILCYKGVASFLPKSGPVHVPHVSGPTIISFFLPAESAVDLAAPFCATFLRSHDCALLHGLPATSRLSPVCLNRGCLELPMSVSVFLAVYESHAQ